MPPAHRPWLEAPACAGARNDFAEMMQMSKIDIAKIEAAVGA